VSNRRIEDGLVTRFCELLGRQHVAAGFLDWIGGWFVPPRARPAFAGVWMLPAETDARSATAEFTGPLVVQTGTDQEHARLDYNLEGAPWKAPRTPWTKHDTPKECDQDRYHGMHGTPCKFEPGGSDTKCPPGAIAGWFWKYEVYGNTYYYVDCCGLIKHSKVWCNWSKEANWCMMGSSGLIGLMDYTCTLSLKRGDFTVSTDPKGRKYLDGVEQGWSDDTKKYMEDARKK
jgi:hypothetical protein